MRADYGISHFYICRQIRELHLAQQRNLVLRQSLRVNDSGVVQHPLEKAYPADSLALGPPGGTVLEILT